MTSTPISEDEVCKIVAGWFQSQGFDAKWVKAGRRGIDIDATHSGTGQRWIVEAKGLTASNAESQNAAYLRVSQAYWMASRWTCLEQYKDVNIGIALPSTYHFDNHSRPIENACRLLGIAIFRVKPDRSIETLPSSLAATVNEQLQRPKELLGAPVEE